MANTYTIKLQNRSGADKAYALATDIPTLKQGKAKGTIWQNVMALAYAANKSDTIFVISKQIVAVNGSYRNFPKVGVSVGVSQLRDVTLGYKTDKGPIERGTTLTFTVKEHKFPQFKSEQSANAPEKTFEIVTDDSFTYEEATANKWYIGLGASVGGDSGTAAVTWTPEPNTTYQIQPAGKYYINFGDYTSGDILDVKSFGKVCLIDFDQVKNPVSIVQNDKNAFVIQS